MVCSSSGVVEMVSTLFPAIGYNFLPRKIKTQLSFTPMRVFVNRVSDCGSGIDNISVDALTLRDICQNRVPEHILRRAEHLGFTLPTEVQRQSLPVLLSRKDCILQAQTGSGKTLAYLLSILSAVRNRRSAVQALVIVPTRELGMQVASVARMLAAKPEGSDNGEDSCTVMALLDGGLLKRHKTWLKAEPPEIVVATIGSLCQMLDKNAVKLDALQVLVVDEVDFMFTSSKQVQELRKVLTSYSTIATRQTIFASASIPQHNRFLYNCVQQKWTKKDVVHVHVNAVTPLPSCLKHRYAMCEKTAKLDSMLFLLETDRPKAGIIFVNDQSEKSKRAGDLPSSAKVLKSLKANYNGGLEVRLLEDDMNFNARAASFSVSISTKYIMLPVHL
ncbi:P-loop containing nucleoside triphosphate hydrolases superfamily protein isoform X2 [Wolffia australiana]